jgi:16S rRNA (cytosine1402-N4)-methyltransferase
VVGVHQTVMLQEAVEALVTAQDGYYVDGTFGRGGHSRKILSMLGAGGHLLAIDKDLQAAAAAQELKESDTRFDFEHGSFTQLPHQLHRMGICAVDGILLDLGVSSPQLDEGDRGFSFMQDGPLDMRMDTTTGMTAAQWLAQASHGDIARVLREYGEERHAGRISSAILRAREEAPLETTAQLAKVVSEANPSWEKHKHPATRAFQGIRIWINRELQDLEDLLEVSIDLLKPGGRLVVISFHSLEDRIVKRFIRRMARGVELPRGIPVTEAQIQREVRALGKASKPSAAEIEANPRARSAVMRVAEKLEQGRANVSA